jgi:hypothetical protein
MGKSRNAEAALREVAIAFPFAMRWLPADKARTAAALATGSGEDATIKIWDVASGHEALSGQTEARDAVEMRSRSA